MAVQPGSYELVLNKYYVDEFYGATVVSRCSASPNTCWAVGYLSAGRRRMLGRHGYLCGALLQRWQSGNLRSYAAWLARNRCGLLLSCSVGNVWPASLNLIWKMAGTENGRHEQLDLTLILWSAAGRSWSRSCRPAKLPNWVAFLPRSPPSA